METRHKILAPELLIEEYRKLLWEENAGPLPLTVTGNSMSPFLIHGRDSVWLSRPPRPVRRGDILLYRRENGMYVLHRVYKVTKESYTMLGDAQTEPERGIRAEQVIAVVTRVERKGQCLVPGCFWWFFFEKIWIRVVPLRKGIHGVFSLLHGQCPQGKNRLEKEREIDE